MLTQHHQIQPTFQPGPEYWNIGGYQKDFILLKNTQIFDSDLRLF